MNPTPIQPSSYGDNCADFYDDIYGPPKAVVVEALTRLARGGSVLELGVGTGRTAIALIGKGLEVTGIESSSAMLEQLRRKTHSHRVRVVEGDFAAILLTERFDLVCALVNTVCLLETRQRQAQCFQNVARMLKTDAVFVVETYRPNHDESETLDEEGRSSFRYELETKIGRRKYEVRLLRTALKELDALAADAGLVLKERWCDWRGTPYTPNSHHHLSLYAQA